MRANLERRWARLNPLLAILTTTGITLRLYWNLERATDLMLADEALYLSAGSRLLHAGVFPTFQW